VLLKSESYKKSCNKQSFNLQNYLIDNELSGCEEDGSTVL